MAQKCVVCDEGITNPICPECLNKEMQVWFFENKPGMMGPLKDIIESFRSYTHFEGKCAICSQNMNVCSHCFSKEVYDKLLDEDELLAGQFLTSFDYEIS